jgi:AcrR family transcriptional regulator
MSASPTARAKHGGAARVRKVGRPPRVKAADTRRRILDVARGVYAERGYEAATNREIADLAHMTTAALYYHFPSKQDLYLAVHDDARRQVYDRFEEVLDPEAGFAGQLLAVLHATHELNEKDPTLASARTDMKRRSDLTHALVHRAQYRQEFFDRIVDVGVRSGEIAPSRRELVSVFIVGMITGMTDALSDDQEMHAKAIEAVAAILDGDLVHPHPTSASAVRSSARRVRRAPAAAR